MDDEEAYSWRRFDKLEHGGCYNLEPDDLCMFYMDRLPGGYSESDANQRIDNLKAKLYSHPQRSYYKIRAIRQCATDMANCLETSGPMENRLFRESILLVPIPPSKAPDDPHYDNRMLQVCREMSDLLSVAYLDCFQAKKSVEPWHESNRSRNIAQIEANLILEVSEIPQSTQNIILIDDVLTSGAHFKACQNLLRQQIQGVNVIGMFWAKQEVPTSEYDDFDFELFLKGFEDSHLTDR